MPFSELVGGRLRTEAGKRIALEDKGAGFGPLSSCTAERDDLPLALDPLEVALPIACGKPPPQAVSPEARYYRHHTHHHRPRSKQDRGCPATVGHGVRVCGWGSSTQ